MIIKKFNQLYENNDIIKKGKLNDILGFSSSHVVSVTEIEYEEYEKLNTIYETKLFRLELYNNFVYILDNNINSYADRSIGDDEQQVKDIIRFFDNVKDPMDKFLEFMSDFLEIRKVYKSVIGVNMNNLDSIPEIKKYKQRQKSNKFNL